MKKKILILGGDKRQIFLKKELSKSNYHVASYGLKQNKTSTKVQDLIKETDYIVFPMPISKNGVDIYAPMSKKNIALQSVIDANLLKEKNTFIPGLNEQERKLFTKIVPEKIFSYCSEELLVSNAKLTAKAAIKIANEKINKKIEKKRVLICGFGRIGKALMYLLKYRCKTLTVSARKSSDFEILEQNKINYINTSELTDLSRYDLIFNTVPAVILNEKNLMNISKNSLIIDLSSKPGGIEKGIAKKLNLNTIHALGLPGKFFPRESGKLIKNSIIKIIKEMEKT